MLLDDLVNKIVALSSPNDLSQLLTALKKEADDCVKRASPASLGPAIQQLDVQQHSLGITFLLLGLAQHGGLSAQGDMQFISLTSQFLRGCAAHQIQLAPDQFCSLCRKFREHLVSAGLMRLGILPLLAALERLRPSPEHLTPIHADAVLLCLLSKCYSAASPLLDQDVFQVEPEKTKVTVQDVLLYCYYGGMVAAGRKRYARALELWLAALTAPTMAASAITAACYKKYVLVCLIHTGAMSPLPKFASGKVRQTAESEARAYNELASAYASHNADKLRRVAEQHAAAFTADGNMGLVRLVVSSLQTRNVQRLTSTYLTLSLADIATSAGLAGPAEAESHVLRMVAAGAVHAQVDERAGMVTFLEDPEQHDSSATAVRIDASIHQCMLLSDRLAALHESVSTDRAYVSKVTAMKERSFVSDELGAAGNLYQP